MCLITKLLTKIHKQPKASLQFVLTIPYILLKQLQPLMFIRFVLIIITADLYAKQQILHALLEVKAVEKIFKEQLFK